MQKYYYYYCIFSCSGQSNEIARNTVSACLLPDYVVEHVWQLMW